ncbi:MAG: peptidylprolyl isomerase [Clostridia bacterium]|nr:peptidylprolyl isomerase [Clostridia bacterium]
MNVTYTDKNGKFQSGSIIVCLEPDVAPITVQNFQSLVGQKFYDGLTFHRVIEGFMIQGGDPKGDGTGDSGKTIVGEFSSNGYTNELSHTRGVISMARGGYDMNSASCQFFIMHETNTDLDGDYAAFGKVVYGMDTVDGIAGTAVKRSGQSAPPINPVTIVSMTFVTPTN